MLTRMMARLACMSFLAFSITTHSTTADAGALDENWNLDGEYAVTWSTSGSPTHGATQEIRYSGASKSGNPVPTNSTTQSQAASPEAGDLLFRGWRQGRRLIGNARHVEPGCKQGFLYQVSGWISEDETKAVLSGSRPVIENCKLAGYASYGPGAHLVLKKQPLNQVLY